MSTGWTAGTHATGGTGGTASADSNGSHVAPPVTQSSGPQPVGAASEGDSGHPTRPERSSVGGIALIVTSAAASQSGAGFGTIAMPSLGALTVVGVRQLIGALVLMPIARPPLHRYQWAQWRPILLLAVSLAGMNSLIYAAFSRIDLGMAVTLEFLGPLLLGVLGSRTRTDVLTALAAGLGVYVLVLPDGTGDAVGIAAALGAGIMWACYIVSGRLAATALPGVEGSATAMTINAIVFLPLLVLTGMHTAASVGWQPWALAALAGLLSSAIPYGLDNVALRRVPAPVFAVFMSIQPVMAALAGLLLLGQIMEPHEWLGTVIVVGANAVAVHARTRRAARASSHPPRA